MDDKEQFNAFDNQKDEVKAREAVEKLRKAPYGMNVITAQIEKDLKRRCGAKEGDVLCAKYLIPDKPEDPKMFFIWADLSRCSVKKEIIIEKSKEIIDEVKKFMPDMHFEIKIVDETI
jgi:hypothetical protein